MNRLFFICLLFLIVSLPSYSNVAANVNTDIDKINVKTDVEVEKQLSDCNVLPYDYSSVEQVPIRVSITKGISTKDGLIEGTKYEFKVLKDVNYDNKLLLKEGDIITGRLETVVSSGMNGFPAEVIFDDFEIPGIKQSQLMSVYIKKGQNRCFWVYPLKWALTIIPFVGSLTNFIMGGHARVKTSDVITLYYYPEWK